MDRKRKEKDEKLQILVRTLSLLERHSSRTSLFFFKKEIFPDDQAEPVWICDWKGRKQRPTPVCLMPCGNFTFLYCRLTAFFCPYKKYQVVDPEGCWSRYLKAFGLAHQANAWSACRLPDLRQGWKEQCLAAQSAFRDLFFAWVLNLTENKEWTKPEHPEFLEKRLIPSRPDENQKKNKEICFLPDCFSDRPKDLKSNRQSSILNLLFIPPSLSENQITFGFRNQDLDSLFFACGSHLITWLKNF